MAESTKKVTEEVTTASKNNVKISLEEYNELVKKASRPVVQNITTVLKTDAQNASDNVVYGVALMVVGGAVAVTGVLLYRHGKKNSP